MPEMNPLRDNGHLLIFIPIVFSSKVQNFASGFIIGWPCDIKVDQYTPNIKNGRQET